jgi:hypothetical protein
VHDGSSATAFDSWAALQPHLPELKDVMALERYRSAPARRKTAAGGGRRT